MSKPISDIQCCERVALILTVLQQRRLSHPLFLSRSWLHSACIGPIASVSSPGVNDAQMRERKGGQCQLPHLQQLTQTGKRSGIAGPLHTAEPNGIGARCDDDRTPGARPLHRLNPVSHELPLWTPYPRPPSNTSANALCSSHERIHSTLPPRPVRRRMKSWRRGAGRRLGWLRSTPGRKRRGGRRRGWHSSRRSYTSPGGPSGWGPFTIGLARAWA